MKIKLSFDSVLEVLRSKEGDTFFDTLIAVNSPKVSEELCLLNSMTRISGLTTKTMSVEEVDDLCLMAKASYISNSYNKVYAKVSAVTVEMPEWLLNKYFPNI